MLIEQIMEKDVENCRAALSQDKELQELDTKFYDLIEGIEGVNYDLEDIFSAFSARCIRIAYLQALKDFYKLCLILGEEDTQEILKRYIEKEDEEE